MRGKTIALIVLGLALIWIAGQPIGQFLIDIGNALAGVGTQLVKVSANFHAGG